MGSRRKEMMPSREMARKSMATATGRRVEMRGIDMRQGSGVPPSSGPPTTCSRAMRATAKS